MSLADAVHDAEEALSWVHLRWREASDEEREEAQGDIEHMSSSVWDILHSAEVEK